MSVMCVGPSEADARRMRFISPDTFLGCHGVSVHIDIDVCIPHGVWDTFVDEVPVRHHLHVVIKATQHMMSLNATKLYLTEGTD